MIDLRESWYFTKQELRCRCGCGQLVVDRGFLRSLNAARHIEGKPWPLNSFYRCPSHNRRVGGSPDSPHLKGMAADIRVADPYRQYGIGKALYAVGFRRIELSHDGHIHVDSDPTKPQDILWLEPNDG